MPVGRQRQEEEMWLVVYLGHSTAKSGSSVTTSGKGLVATAMHTSLLVLGCHMRQSGVQMWAPGRVVNLLDDSVRLASSEKSTACPDLCPNSRLHAKIYLDQFATVPHTLSSSFVH